MKTRNDIITSILTLIAKIDDSHLEQLAQLINLFVTGKIKFVDGVLTVDNGKSDNALVESKAKPERFSAKSLKCTKGIPSKVWSAIHHSVIENGGSYDRKTKTWTFKTIKACKAVYDAQVAYAKAHDTELCITTC